MNLNLATLNNLSSQGAFFQTAVQDLAKNSFTLATSNHTWECWNTGDDSPLLVMLHGGMIGPNMWFYPAHTLAKRYRIIVPHIPGDLTEVNEIITFFHALLEHEHCQSATVIGYFYGGGSPECLGTKHPNS